jgi:tRNA1(Val) A37 N6-methylase TrmN6
MFGLFKKKKQKELLNEIINTEVKEQATEVAVETIKPSKKQAEVEVQHTDTKDD